MLRPGEKQGPVKPRFLKRASDPDYHLKLSKAYLHFPLLTTGDIKLEPKRTVPEMYGQSECDNQRLRYSKSMIVAEQSHRQYCEAGYLDLYKSSALCTVEDAQSASHHALHMTNLTASGIIQQTSH